MFHRNDSHPFEVKSLVESERRAGVDLAWIVILGIAICVAAIVFAIPDRLLNEIEDLDSLDFNGAFALAIVVPLGASFFAIRRYHDAIGAQRELTRLSLHDALTGLPNRRHLREVMPSAFRHAQRHNTQAAVFFLDLDGFKAVNDTYGHEVGDKLMQAVADRFRHCCEPDKWAARYAGDEFVLIDATCPTHDHAARFAAELVKLIEAPFELGEDQISISASVGVAFGDDSTDPVDVLSDADSAMYEAKSGDDRTALWTDSMRSLLTPSNAEKRLEIALEAEQLKLLFQPIIALRTRQMVGVEALLRWDDPERGVITPDDFLSALEDTGLIVPVGRWVIAEASRQARRWQDMTPQGQIPLRVTVNISPRQIAQADFVDDIRTALGDAAVTPNLVYVELSEIALVSDPHVAWRALNQIHDLGVGLALDDFGTGYSSLTHLRNFDFDLLKLDGSWIHTLGANPRDEAIIRHVVSLGREMGIATIAEGISEASHADLMLEFGCELGQGFYFSEAQPIGVIDELLRRRTGAQPTPDHAGAAETRGSGHDAAEQSDVVVPTSRATPPP